MQENLKELSNDLDISKEVWEMFSNKYFLTYLVNYLNEELNFLSSSEKDNSNSIDTINSFLNSILEVKSHNIDWKIEEKESIKKEIDINDVYLFVFDYFSYGNAKNFFIEYIWSDPKFNRPIIQEEFTKFLKVWDFLLSKLNNSSNFNDEEILNPLLDWLKLKISDIILDDFKNAVFELRANWYSSITENWVPISKVDFNNSFTFWDETFVFVEYTDKNFILKKVYINKNGKIYRNRKNNIVTSIDYTFNFGWYNFLKTIDIYWNNIIDTLGLDWNTKSNIFNVNDVTIENLNINNFDLEYLIASYRVEYEGKTISKSNIFNNEMEKIKISDLLYFMNTWKIKKNKDDDFKSNNYLVDFDYEYEISEINWWKYFDGINFLELTVFNSTEKESIVITSNGKILSDNEGFVWNINNLDKILDYKFLSYWKYHWTMGWYLDRDMNAVEIEILEDWKKQKHKLFIIKKIDLIYKGENYYMINNDPKKVISEESLNLQLSKYNSFIWIKWIYNLDISDQSIEIENKKYTSIKISELYDDSFVFNLYTTDDFKNNIEVVWFDNLFKLLKWKEKFVKNIVFQLDRLTK